MTTPSVFCLSKFLRTADGMVVGPAWTDHLGRELLRALRMAQPAAPDSDLSGPEDLAVVARVYHEVLSLCPGAERWPVFAKSSERHSLFKSAVLSVAVHDEAALWALCRLDEDGHLLASNVARWLLQLPQQTVLTLVFAAPPEAHASRPRASRATARPVQKVA